MKIEISILSGIVQLSKYKLFNCLKYHENPRLFDCKLFFPLFRIFSKTSELHMIIRGQFTTDMHVFQLNFT